MSSWPGGNSERTEYHRPPRPLVDVAEQLALAAAADFTRRLTELVVEDMPDVSEASRSRAAGAASPDGELDRVDTEELDMVRSRMHALAALFNDKFTSSVDEQVMNMWKQQHEDDRGDGGDTVSAGAIVIKKGGKLRRSFKKKFTRKKVKETPEAEAERKQLKRLEKEGNLKQLVEIEGGEVQWVKCRVCLKRQPGGFMLSFFSPPKSSQPRSGVFCFLVTEVRQTTQDEIPDVEHAFVVRGVNNMEYILLCHSNTDMWAWIAALRECSRLDSVQRDVKTGQNGRPYEVPSDDDDEEEPPPPPPPETSSHDEGPPPLPPDDTSRVPPPQMAGEERLPPSTSSNSLDGMVSPDPLPDRGQTTIEGGMMRRQPSIDSTGVENIMEHIEPLLGQPWFHGLLSRQEATMLVCQGSSHAHGTFLVRQSESRQGQLVLTFNCRGRAKHMRMTIIRGGQCKVHQWTFDDVFHMLDYFKIHPVPLDNGADSDVILTSYIVASSAGPLSPGPAPGFVTGPPVPIPGGIVMPGPFPQQPQLHMQQAPPGRMSSPSHLGPHEGAHPAYVNDVFPGGIMISPPSMQALHEHSGSNPIAMGMVPANSMTPVGGGGQPVQAMRVAVSASGPVSRPRSSTFTRMESGEMRQVPVRTTNEYHVS